MIEVRNLTKKYGSKMAISNVSFTIDTGKVTGFLGPNGAGKSTTMRAMLGLDNTEGETLFDGQPLSAHKDPMQVVGFLLDAKSYHPTRTARNHLLLLARSSNVPDSRVDEVLALVGLQDVAGKRPGKFSLGMAQRLGLAAALLGDPQYLMLDEPANGLDPEGIHWLRDFLKNYAASGKGVLVSSHILSEMQLMADNLIVIGKGVIIANSSIQELIDSVGSASVFVRTAELDKLAAGLTGRSIAFTPERNGLKISGVTLEQVSTLLFELGLPALELAAENVSLEDAFLKMTAGAQEYQTAPNTVAPVMPVQPQPIMPVQPMQPAQPIMPVQTVQPMQPTQQAQPEQIIAPNPPNQTPGVPQ